MYEKSFSFMESKLIVFPASYFYNSTKLKVKFEEIILNIQTLVSHKCTHVFGKSKQVLNYRIIFYVKYLNLPNYRW